MKNIINSSYDFSSLSYSLIDSQNNKYSEHSSFYENSYTLKSWIIRQVNLDDNSISQKFKSSEKNNILATDLSYMFYNCTSLISITGLSKINTSNVKKMEHMFENCSLLKQISDISKWDINCVIDISNMFQDCSSLKSLPDISNWNTNQIENISEIFSNCSSLISLPDISKWNTSNVSDMNRSFYNCSKLP